MLPMDNRMTEEMISVIDAAAHLGKRKATIFKVMKRLHIEATKRRSSSNGNQLVACISKADFRRISGEFLGATPAGTGESDAADGQGNDDLCLAEQGVFYLIQLEPNHDPGRFKVGFAANMVDRLRALRCSAPYATPLRTWQCRRLWERTAIDCVTVGCDRVHTEVFRTDSLEQVMQKCEQFFALMPGLNTAHAGKSEEIVGQ